MKDRLCGSCVYEKLDKCLFKTFSKETVKALPPSKNQTPINNSGATTEAAAAHFAIAELRGLARDLRHCPQVNYEPQYPKYAKNL